MTPKEEAKQLPIPEMKSFYCEKQTNLLKQCANECDYCKSIKLQRIV